MKKIVLKFLTSLYSYYRTGGTSDIPYFSTFIALVGVLILHFMTLSVIFGWNEYNVVICNLPRLVRYILFFLAGLPLYLLVNYLFPEEILQKEMESEPNLRQGRYYAFGYIAFAIALFILTLLTVKGVVF